MADGKEEKPAIGRQAILLRRGQRWASGLLGAAAGGGGTAATFLTDNQAGSTALLLAGGLGLLMSLTGRVPDRIGREGVVHEAVDAPATEVVRQVLTREEVGPGVRAEVARLYEQEASRGAWQNAASTRVFVEGNNTAAALSKLSREVLYNQAVMTAINAALPPAAYLATEFRTHLPGGGTLRLDAVVSFGDQLADRPHAVAIDVRARAISGSELKDLLGLVLEQSGFGALLIVTPVNEQLTRGRAVAGGLFELVPFLAEGEVLDQPIESRSDFRDLKSSLSHLLNQVTDSPA